MMLAMLLVQASVAAAPSAEAIALGTRLARGGWLSTIATAATEKDAAELAKDHPELSAAEQESLRATARQVAEADIGRLAGAIGRGYAERLSLDDLRALVTASESEAAKHRAAIELPVLTAATAAMGKLDYKADVSAAFCRDAGKLCPTPPKAK